MYSIFAKTFQRGTIFHTDSAPCYMRLQEIDDADGVSMRFCGEAVNHSQGQYARTGIDGTRIFFKQSRECQRQSESLPADAQRFSSLHNLPRP